MSDKIKRVFKLILAWQEEKEEKWLREMAQKGWLLKSYFLGLYTFEKAEPADYIYKFDYIGGRNIDKEEYLSIFRDAGWEHVTEFAGWQYFRVKADNCRYPDIYSDNISRIEKYRSLLRILYIGFFINLLNILNLFFNMETFNSGRFVKSTRIFVLLILIILFYAIYRIRKVKKKLEDEL
ncbi:MAG: DUF2812 domain-containing protein [Halothermotrichaceae bacterium]